MIYFGAAQRKQTHCHDVGKRGTDRGGRGRDRKPTNQPNEQTKNWMMQNKSKKIVEYLQQGDLSHIKMRRTMIGW